MEKKYLSSHFFAIFASKIHLVEVLSLIQITHVTAAAKRIGFLRYIHLVLLVNDSEYNQSARQ
jgi:hypothetical protein